MFFGAAGAAIILMVVVALAIGVLTIYNEGYDSGYKCAAYHVLCRNGENAK